MASFSKMFDNLKLRIYDKYSEHPGKLLVFAGTLGWTLSCIAQVGAIVFNEKLSSKDKKFLIPQEITDGVVNVGLFFAITKGLHSYTDKMIESGKIMFSEIKKPLTKELERRNINLSQALKENDGKISNILTDKIAKENFIKLKGGTALSAALLGSIISCNIITPIIRNSIGAKFQKRLSKTSNNLELQPTQPFALSLEHTIHQPLKQNKTNTSFGYNKFYTSSNLKI